MILNIIISVIVAGKKKVGWNSRTPFFVSIMYIVYTRIKMTTSIM